MAGILVPQRFDRQPPHVARIDSNDPLARGLVFAQTANYPDALSGVKPQHIGTPNLKASPDGLGWSTSTAAGEGPYFALPSDHPLYSITNQFTSIQLVRIDAWASFSALWNIPFAAGTWNSPYGAVGVQRDSGNNAIRLWGTNASESWICPTPVVAGGYYFIAVSRNGDNVTFNVNGISSTVGYPGASGFNLSAKQPVNLLNRSNSAPGEGVQGQSVFLYLWSRALTSGEMESVRQRKWATFKAPARRIWIPVSTGLPGAYTLIADTASFSLTGQPTGLKADRRLSAQTATFGLTGNNAGLKAGRKLQAATASFAVTGNAATLKADRRLSATTASFAVTGIDAALTYNPLAKTLTATVGSFVLTGNTTALRADRRLSAVAGSYTLTAQAANLRASRRISAQTASYAITGNTAGLRAARRLMANAANYTLTGIDVGLTKSNQRTLSATTASFAVTGIAATLKADRRLLAETGQIVLTANAAGMARGYRLAATTGAYALTGQAAAFRRAYRLAAIHAQFALTGNAVNLVYSPNFDGVLAFSPGSMLSYQRRITKVDGQPRIRSIQ